MNELEARKKRFQQRQQAREELGRLLKEQAELERGIAEAEDMQRLIRLTIEAKERGEEGFYIPPELAYLQDEFEELIASCEGGEPC